VLGDGAARRRHVRRSPAHHREQLEGLLGEHEPRAPWPRCSPPTSSTRPASAGRARRRRTVERIVETKYTEACPRTSWRPGGQPRHYVFDANALFDGLDQVGLERGERYLTGVFPVIRENGARSPRT
jgi:hypothetical protein